MIDDIDRVSLGSHGPTRHVQHYRTGRRGATNPAPDDNQHAGRRHSPGRRRANANTGCTVTPGQDRNTVGMQDAPIGAQPKVVHPNFADANAAGGPFYSPELTTKGRALSLLLSGVEGAANGMAASMPINGGHTGGGG